MDTAKVLQYLYPNADPLWDYRVEDDGLGGGIIVYWNEATLGPQPSLATLQANVLPATKSVKRIELLLAFKVDYGLIWVIDGIEVEEQKDSILAKTAAQRTAAETALVNQAGTLITKIKSKLTDVRNATTEAQVEAITW